MLRMSEEVMTTGVHPEVSKAKPFEDVHFIAHRAIGSAAQAAHDRIPIVRP